MEEFNIASYLAAIVAIGGPLLWVLRVIIKKGGPIITKYGERLMGKLDEVVDENKNHSKAIDNHLEDSERYREDVERRFNATLGEIKDVTELVQENRKRITDLELFKRTIILDERQAHLEDEIYDIWEEER